MLSFSYIATILKPMLPMIFILRMLFSSHCFSDDVPQATHTYMCVCVWGHPLAIVVTLWPRVQWFSSMFLKPQMYVITASISTCFHSTSYTNPIHSTFNLVIDGHGSFMSLHFKLNSFLSLHIKFKRGFLGYYCSLSMCR